MSSAWEDTCDDVREPLFLFFFPRSYEMVISLEGMSKDWTRKKKSKTHILKLEIQYK